MYPILFKIGNFSFYTHGFLAVLGIVAGGGLIYLLAKKRGMDYTFLFDNIVYSVLAGIIGARLTYYFLYPEQFTSIKELSYLWQGGMVSYGGFILGGILLFILLKKQKQNLWAWFDIIAIGFFLGLAFGRIGNIFAGESGGTIPVTTYEAILCAMIFLVFYVYYLLKKERKSGIIFLGSTAVYGIGRFILDFWRDEDKLISFLSIGQIIDIIIFILGATMLILLWLKRKDTYGA